MGGYWTTAEIKQKLDQLVLDDAHDVVANRIDTVGYSRGGRPIWGLQLGNTSTGPTIARWSSATRSPMRASRAACRRCSTSSTICSPVTGPDPFATYLLDHRVIYVVPLVNPDGYAINEQTWFTAAAASACGARTRATTTATTYSKPSPTAST